MSNARLVPHRATPGAATGLSAVILWVVLLVVFSGCGALSANLVPAAQPEQPASGTSAGPSPDSVAASAGVAFASGHQAAEASVTATSSPLPVPTVRSMEEGDGGLALPAPARSGLVGSSRSPYASDSASRLPTNVPSAPAAPTVNASPQVAQAKPPLPSKGVFTYTVAAGDTLSSIAVKFQISMRTIVMANELNDVDALAAGRELTILPSSGVLHRVVDGETVLALAERYYVIPEEIAAANGLAEPYPIRAGALLLIPEALEGAARAHGEAPGVTAAAAEPTAIVRGKRSYAVVAGDTLAEIGRRFGVSIAALAAANSLDPARPLSIGRQLTIPPVGGIEHVVQKGDTVIGVAAQYGASASDTIRVNGLAEPYLLAPGQILLVPGGTPPPATATPPPATPTAPPMPPATPTPTRTPPAAGAIAGNEYQVVAGDTLAKIASRAGVTVPALVAANGLDTAKPLPIGLRLKIPAPAKAPVSGPSPSASPTLKPTAVPAPTFSPSPTPVATRAPAPSPTAVPTRAPTPPVSPSSPPGPARGDAAVAAKILSIAKGQLGARYTWGGASPQSGFDCSGFVMWVYRQAGIAVPRDIWGQLKSGPRVEKAALQPGDLVFFQNTYMPGLSHNGIFLGGGQFIHAASERTGVIISRLDTGYWSDHYLSANRSW